MQSVLVVDPSEMYFRSIKRVLHPLGLKVLHESSCDQAEARIVADPPALALVDAFSPEMDGFTLIRRLSRHPVVGSVPLVMMAPAPAATQKVRALWFGAKDFIIKPLDEDELLEAVRVHLVPRVKDVSVAY